MSFKTRVALVIPLLLTTGLVFAQQNPNDLPATPAAPSKPPTPPTAPAPATAPIPFDPNGHFSLFVGGGSFLGVYAEDIDNEKAARYGMREARGVGITEVIKDSPAEKAGLRKDDVIVRFDGENVTSVRKLNRMVSEVAVDQTVRLGISRGGAEQDVSVTIGKQSNNYTSSLGKLDELRKAPGLGVWRSGSGDTSEGYFFGFGNQRRIGVSTVQLTKQLADYFGIAEGSGVLVTAVTDDSPAAKAGVKAGDVITAVDGEKIDSAGDLSRVLNKKKEGDVTLTVVRSKNQRTITVTPKEGTANIIPAGQLGVTLPRIEIPTINIQMPRIQIPTIPPVNIQIPARVWRTKGGASGPI